MKQKRQKRKRPRQKRQNETRASILTNTNRMSLAESVTAEDLAAELQKSTADREVEQQPSSMAATLREIEQRENYHTAAEDFHRLVWLLRYHDEFINMTYGSRGHYVAFTEDAIEVADELTFPCKHWSQEFGLMACRICGKTIIAMGKPNPEYECEECRKARRLRLLNSSTVEGK